MVIAIIALPISVLMPPLNTAREQAKQSVCTAHVKNIATSGEVYAADDPNDTVIPVHPFMFQQDPANPSFIGTYEWGGKSGIGETGWVAAAAGKNFFLGSRYGTKAGYGPAARSLHGILYAGGFCDYSPSGTEWVHQRGLNLRHQARSETLPVSRRRRSAPWVPLSGLDS